eukprot:Phypoly_transcript_06453.p1 GENE.Phypoly_transcript_06453~~Phypoly_transcript_06453.p1  ORF type:complete len:475 (+),score=60.27 Phypoly_transcript_06453:360-1784(+)
MEAEKEIEEFFAKCVDALAVRKDTLLRELGSEISHQKNETEDVRKQLKRAKELREKLLEAGAFVYPSDRKIAAHVWEGVANLVEPQFTETQIKLELSGVFLESIKMHGKVFVAKSNNNSSSKPNPPKPDPDPLKPELLEPDQPSNPKHDLPKSAPLKYDTPKKPDPPKPDLPMPKPVVEIKELFVGSKRGLADGKREQAQFNSLSDMCWNPKDNCFYVCDKKNYAIRAVTLQGEVRTIIRKAPAWGIFGTDGMDPECIVMHHDTNSFFVKDGKYIRTITEGRCSKESLIPFLAEGPTYFAIAQQSGNIFVSNIFPLAPTNWAEMTRNVAPEAGRIFIFAGSKSGSVDAIGTITRLSTPKGLFFDDVENSLLVCDYGNNLLQVVNMVDWEVSTVAKIPQPMFVTKYQDLIFVASAKKVYFGKRGETFCPLMQLVPGKDPKECTFDTIKGLAYHGLSNSCFVLTEYSIHKLTIKFL